MSGVVKFSLSVFSNVSARIVPMTSIAPCFGNGAICPRLPSIHIRRNCSGLTLIHETKRNAHNQKV